MFKTHQQPFWRGAARKLKMHSYGRWLLLGAVIFIGALLVVNASATPPTAVEQRAAQLVNKLKSDKETVERHAAQQELEQMGEDAVPALVTALHADNVTLRGNAANMLGFIASPRATASLIATLGSDSAPQVRRNAAWALGEINSLASLHALSSALVLDHNLLVQQAVTHALERVTARLAAAANIPRAEMSAYAASPADPDVIYVTLRRDLYITQDGGKTFETLKQSLPSVANVLIVSPTDAQLVYAGVDSMGLHISNDGGRTWMPRSNGLNLMPGARFVVTALAFDPTNSQKMYAATGVWLGTTDVEFYPLALMQTADGGKNWSTLREVQQREPLTHMFVRDNRLYALAGTHVVMYAAR